MVKRLLRRLKRDVAALPWLALGCVEPLRKKPRPSGNEIKSLLIVKCDALGDALMTTPLLRAVARCLPAARLEIFTTTSSAPIFAMNSDVAAVHAFAAGKWAANFRLWRDLRRKRYDVVLDASTYLWTACLCRSLAPRYSVGFSREFRFGWSAIKPGGYYHDLAPHDEKCGVIELHHRLADQWLEGSREGKMNIAVPEEPRQFAARWFREKNLDPSRCVVVHPGGKWPPRHWPAACWRETAQALSLPENGGLIPLFVGNGSDAQMVEEICEQLDSPAAALLGADIRSLAAVVEKSRIVVGNDSFIVHLAQALRKPVVALFGPMNPGRIISPSATGIRVIYAGLFCSPCAPYYTANRCRRGLNFCMRAIKPADVVEAVVSLAGIRSAQKL